VAPIDDKEHLLLSCESTKDIRLRFAGLPMSSLRDLMQCEDVGSVAWFVHEYMEKVNNSNSALVLSQCSAAYLACYIVLMFLSALVLFKCSLPCSCVPVGHNKCFFVQCNELSLSSWLLHCQQCN
jgi:hypothetical protein